ncbi:hypothetical protein Syun_031506 [Stephania yunnanensis]|uniref:Uncharacterized protein n=1 Tax=Stephania yunnanensis TaxID=152371 RepID=A0AAP0HH07_9MAGN
MTVTNGEGTKRALWCWNGRAGGVRRERLRAFLMGVVHTTGGYMIYTTTTFRYAFDYKPTDISWYATKGKNNIPSWLSPGAQNLIRRILDPNPATRITIAEIKEDGWFNQDYIPSTNHDDEELEDDFQIKDNVKGFTPSKNLQGRLIQGWVSTFEDELD